MMKINEKNLCTYAVSPSVAADKEGYLVKRGEVNKGFQKRWFVLKGNLLFYFEKRSDKEPLGVIILEGCTIELDENDCQFSFKIIFHGAGNRTYILCAESQESMEQWMKLLACASYDYMKLMVTELQRQLKETRKGEKIQNEKESYPVSKNAAGSASLIIFNDGGSDTAGNNSKTSYTTPSSSPHPPPRNRPRAPVNQPTSRVKTSNQINNTTTIGFNSRNKISFHSLHTSFGRPVLRDRNMWRHNKKSSNTLDVSASPAVVQSRQIPQQNLLISL